MVLPGLNGAHTIWCTDCFPKESIPVSPVTPLTMLLKSLVDWRKCKPSPEGSKLDWRLFGAHPHQVSSFK